METLTRFARGYLENWERKANVRAKSRYLPDAAENPVDLFPRLWLPLLEHPEIRRLGHAAEDFLILQTCYTLFNDIAVLETDEVGQLCADLAHRDRRVEIPMAVRQVALTVATDEAYHAFAAREYIDRIADLTGVRPLSLQGVGGLGAAMKAGRAAVPADHLDDLNVIMLCLAENMLTAEVMLLHHDAIAQSSFARVQGEHLMDEARHNAFFQRLLRYYWQSLAPAAQDAVALGLASYYARLIGSDDLVAVRHRLTFAAIGLTDEDKITAILATPRRHARPADAPVWQNQCRILDQAGLTAHPAVRRSLETVGILAPAG